MAPVGTVQAFMTSKVLNFSLLISHHYLYFYMRGILFGQSGIIMMVGQTTGAWLGSHCLLTINPKYLRFLVVLMSFTMLYQYIHNSWINYIHIQQ